MADMHDAATAEAASLYEFEHGNVTRVRFDAQALAPVLTGNRLGGLQQIATKTLPAMTLGNRNTMQHGISRVARVGRRQPCALDGIVNRFRFLPDYRMTAPVKPMTVVATTSPSSSST